MDALDHLAKTAMNTGAQAALLEAHRLLTLRQLDDAAEALLQHWESISKRVAATYEAQAAIDKAREGIA